MTAVVCLTPIVSHSIGRSVYGLLLPAIEDDLGLSHGQSGIPSSGIYVLYIVGVLGVVFAAPRLEPITIMRVAIGVSIVGLLIAATAQGVAMLALGVSMVGGAGAGIWMTAPVLATEHVSEHRRGVVIGVLTSTIGLANIALGFGTGALRRQADDELLWRPIWWIALAFTALLLAALLLFVRFDRSERLGTHGLTLRIVRQIPHWKQITVGYALFGGMSAGFGAFIIAAMEEHGGLSRSSSAAMFSIMGIAGMVAAPVSGALSDRIGRMTVMRIALVVLACANVLVALGSSATVVVGALLYAAGGSSFPTLVATLVRDTLGSRSFSQALAVMTLLFSVTAAVTPTVVGAVADATGSFAVPYLLIGALPAAAFVILSTTGRRQVNVSHGR